jgi:hypothetical protein
VSCGSDAILSADWTGRPAHAGTPLTMLRWRLYGLLYPGFECEQCVGQAREYAHCCYCAYNGAIGPSRGAGPIREWLRSFAWRWLRIEGADYQEDING